MTLPDNIGILTLVLFFVTLAAWTGLEFFYVLTGRPSISDQVVTLYQQWPTVALLMGLVIGLLLGHWFWRS